jgi:hypothetical protein
MARAPRTTEGPCGRVAQSWSPGAQPRRSSEVVAPMTMTMTDLLRVAGGSGFASRLRVKKVLHPASRIGPVVV